MSAQIAALTAHAVFWALMVVGLASGELTARSGGVVLCLWMFGFLGLQAVCGGRVPLASFVAILDVALVFIIFKGDVPLN